MLSLYASYRRQSSRTHRPSCIVGRIRAQNKQQDRISRLNDFELFQLYIGGRGEKEKAANRIKKRIDFTKIDRANVPEPGSRALSADIDLECGSSWFASLSGPTDLLLVFDRLSRFFIVPKKSRRFLLVLPLSTIIRRWHAMVYDSTILPKFRLYVAYTWWKRREGNHAVKLLPSELEEFGVLSGPDVTLVSFGPCWNEGSC